MNALENFILQLPSGVLRKVSYAWFGIVVFYPWAILALIRSPREGILLFPVRSEGFTRLIDRIFLAPKEPQ